MTTASGHRYIVRRDDGAVRVADIQSDCPSAICICECACNQKQRNSVSDSNGPLVFVCTLYCRTLRPDIVSSASRARAFGARQLIIIRAPPHQYRITVTRISGSQVHSLELGMLVHQNVLECLLSILKRLSKSLYQAYQYSIVCNMCRRCHVSNSFPCAKIRFFQNTQTTYFEVIISKNVLVLYEIFENF